MTGFETMITQEAIDRGIAEGRRLRSQALLSVLATAFVWIKRPVVTLLTKKKSTRHDVPAGIRPAAV